MVKRHGRRSQQRTPLNFLVRACAFVLQLALVSDVALPVYALARGRGAVVRANNRMLNGDLTSSGWTLAQGINLSEGITISEVITLGKGITISEVVTGSEGITISKTVALDQKSNGAPLYGEP